MVEREMNVKGALSDLYRGKNRSVRDEESDAQYFHGRRRICGETIMLFRMCCISVPFDLLWRYGNGRW